MEEIQIIEELEKAKNMLTLKKSAGGKIIVKDLESEIKLLTYRVARMYADLSHMQLIAELAKLSSKINLLEDINKSEERVQILTDELKNLENK